MNTAGAPGDALEIELVGSDDSALEAAALAALARLNVSRGHLAIEIVSAQRIGELNSEFRGKQGPTDVLSFPVDGEEVASGAHVAIAPPPGPAQPGRPGSEAELPPLELGDIVICPAHTINMAEATVHGVLHLCGFDHETDDGEMLALQDAIIAALETTPPEAPR